MTITGKMLISLTIMMLSAAKLATADEQYDKCVDPNGTNVDWSKCGSDMIKRKEDQLNAIWQRLSGMVDDQTRADLTFEQNAWMAFKEASCRFDADGLRGRDGQVIGFPACRSGIIDDRIKTLKSYATEFSQQ